MQVFDTIVVGSGFGGSVTALRRAEAGDRVLVLEQGRRFGPADFPKSNWDLRRYFWAPRLGFRGPFRMSFFRHVTVLSGVGVGGGSLVYANTLPVPGPAFFEHGSWRGLADWQAELAPHYDTAKRMLGAARNPYLGRTDHVLRELAVDQGLEAEWSPTDVAVHFGKPGLEVDDPYFGGRGPRRTGCTRCGGCMLGCRVGAKNTLDKNYLYLAEALGAEVRAETTVEAVRPLAAEDGGAGYVVEARHGGEGLRFWARRVVLSGGVLGTVDLLLRMKADPAGLPGLSDHVGRMVRTNSESILGVTGRGGPDFTDGIAIGSILHTDAVSHLETVRYPAGSGLYRLMVLPHAPGATLLARLLAGLRYGLTRPLRMASALLVRDWSKSTAILLYMRATDGTLAFRRSAFGLSTTVDSGEPPRAYLPEASALAERFADKIDGTVVNMFTETVADIPTTAHILGGACIGRTADDGVIGPDHQVHGYPGLYVCDGSAVSANPGVNPSLTITAMTERAMSRLAGAS